MLSALINIFKIPDLKRRLFITAVLLIVYRIGCYVSTPGIDGAALSKFLQQIGTTAGPWISSSRWATSTTKSWSTATWAASPSGKAGWTTH